MKRIFLLFSLVLLFFNAKSQKPLSYEFVIKADSVSADMIYIQLLDWVSTNFRSTDADMFKDRETKLITKDVSTEFNTDKIRIACYSGTLHYKLKFQCRDGRFKVKLTNFYHENKPTASEACQLGLIYDIPQSYSYPKYDEIAWTEIVALAGYLASEYKKEFDAMDFGEINDDW